LEGLGHVVRLNGERTIKKLLESKSRGERPRLQQMDDAELDLRTMGVKRWRTRASDRTEWASVTREAMAKTKC
jgi:hypothetical protein